MKNVLSKEVIKWDMGCVGWEEVALLTKKD